MRALIGFCLLLSACGSHEVRCDARLQPINLPAPRVEPGAAAVKPAATATATAGAADTASR